MSPIFSSCWRWMGDSSGSSIGLVGASGGAWGAASVVMYDLLISKAFNRPIIGVLLAAVNIGDRCSAGGAKDNPQRSPAPCYRGLKLLSNYPAGSGTLGLVYNMP